MAAYTNRAVKVLNWDNIKVAKTSKNSAVAKLFNTSVGKNY